MTGIVPSFLCHELNVNKEIKPVKQRRRVFSLEKNQAIREDIEKLQKASFIEDVKYPDWLANVVMVKKKNNKWRMCVDFTDLNKACPKDHFPSPRIDQLVDATSRHELLSFMDAYSGYNQIKMKPEDRESTSFITLRGTYYYNVMTFGLKNAGATYHRLMNKVFADQISHNMEVYVDDMLTKSKRDAGHLIDLGQTFDQLDKYQMKLNPTKCIFEVREGMFLGYIVNQ